MTDGDITRLNRMYKCKNFEEEEVEIFKETTSKPTTTDGVENEIDARFIQDEIEVNDRVKSFGHTHPNPMIAILVRTLQTLTARFLSLIKPLLDFMTKLVPALNSIKLVEQ